MLIFFGVSLIMCYNRVPYLATYWSKNESFGNAVIKKSISRDRYSILASKLYFAMPEKPADASKTYYIDHLINCLKFFFQRADEDSTFQSIDETMVKFKGRSSLKQYLPLKPIKRGIKLLSRCDSLTGYCYDLNVYAGKEVEQMEGTFGERVVTELCSTIQKSEVALTFNRFFTSVKLLDTILYPAVGTLTKTRKSTLIFNKNLEKYESKFIGNNNGTLCVQWRDTKIVCALSNCHRVVETSVERMQKNGEKLQVRNPEIFEFYNMYMDGVDLSDQLSSLYDDGRRISKWWKKVSYKCLLISAVNSWIICRDLSQNRYQNQNTSSKVAFLNFLVLLVDDFTKTGRELTMNRKRSTVGRPSKRMKYLQNIGDHMPIISSRRRCRLCADKKIEKMTKVMCCE